VALSNLDCAFGGTMTSARKRSSSANRTGHFRAHHDRPFLEPLSDRENYSRYIEVVNLNLVEAEMKKGQRIVLPAATTAISNG